MPSRGTSPKLRVYPCQTALTRRPDYPHPSAVRYRGVDVKLQNWVGIRNDLAHLSDLDRDAGQAATSDDAYNARGRGPRAAGHCAQRNVYRQFCREKSGIDPQLAIRDQKAFGIGRFPEPGPVVAEPFPY